MKVKSKTGSRITLLYGLIVILANICGVLLPSIFMHNEMTTDTMQGWLEFLHVYKIQTDAPQYLTFLIPTLLCIAYMRSKKSEESKIINCPIAFSTIGSLGWFVYFFEEIIFVIIAKCMAYDVDAKVIISSSFVNILMESIVTFTLAYFITETINRKYILPKYFSDGHISKIEGVKQPSISFLFIVNYFSVTLFPLLFILVAYSSAVIQLQGKVETGIIIVLAVIIAIGLVITVSFKNYFDKPLNKLVKRVQMIENGDYKTKTIIATNDSLGELSDVINDMAESIDRKLIDTIKNMAIMVEGRDRSTGGHIRRTSDCVEVFVKQLKNVSDSEYSDKSEAYWDSLVNAAPMHDLGKIAVDDAILRKPGKFTDEEYEKMKKHSEEGAVYVERILSNENNSEFKTIAINVAHYHHEKWNGQGYPAKLCGEDIPFESRVMALADVFDALVSKRCYKENFTYDQAFQIIQESLGSHFDPKLGAEFIKCRPQLEELYNSYPKEELS